MAFTASQAFDLLRTAFSRNRLPHALLIVGDEHQGASRLILQLLELMNGIRADHLDSVRDEYCRLVRPKSCLLCTSPSPRDRQKSRMPSSA